MLEGMVAAHEHSAMTQKAVTSSSGRELLHKLPTHGECRLVVDIMEEVR
jgi:hypothetical protein